MTDDQGDVGGAAGHHGHDHHGHNALHTPHPDVADPTALAAAAAAAAHEASVPSPADAAALATLASGAAAAAAAAVDSIGAGVDSIVDPASARAAASLLGPATEESDDQAADPAAAAAAAAAADADEAGEVAPAAKRRRTKKNAVAFPDDLIDVLDNKHVVKKIPLRPGKGVYHPPWSWRTDVGRVRMWRDLTDEQQRAEKEAWVSLGTARQDEIIREVRLRNQSKTLWLVARAGKQPGGPSAPPSDQLREARQSYEQAWNRRARALREEADSKAALEEAQRRYEAASLEGQACDIDEAERSLINAEISESVPWNDMYAQLCAFKERHGHVRVPNSKIKCSPDDIEGVRQQKLSAWVMRNRAMYKLYRDPPENPDGTLKPVSIGQITPHRIEALENLGFVWNTKEENWRKMFEELKRYRNERGHMRVSLGNQPALYRWADRQKLQYLLLKRGEPSHLTTERYNMLDSIGFAWWNTGPNATGGGGTGGGARDGHPQKIQERSADFEKYYLELIEFRNKFGHTRVAHRKGTGPPQQITGGERVNWRLVQWVTWIRKQFKLKQAGKLGEDDKLDDDKIRRLEEIGFEFVVEGRPINPHAATASVAAVAAADATGPGHGEVASPAAPAVAAHSELAGTELDVHAAVGEAVEMATDVIPNGLEI